MEQGGFYAQPNLRGGGEYGEKWHQAGMFEHKQNVFDDFFAAAQYLTDEKIHFDTATGHPRALEWWPVDGRRHDAASRNVRRHLVRISAARHDPLPELSHWQMVDDANTDQRITPEQFSYLLKYSPYQNVKPGTKFPAIMFNTGDSDTRVDPLHARKMTALVQVDNASDRPVLLHYQTVSGHSAGVSITQAIKDTADELAFLWNEVSGE